MTNEPIPANKDLTPFGLWLWRRWPLLADDDIARGEAFVGLRSPLGFMWAGLLTDYYHGYWPRLGLLYWRRSVWVFGIRIAKWQRITARAHKEAMKVEIV